MTRASFLNGRAPRAATLGKGTLLPDGEPQPDERSEDGDGAGARRAHAGLSFLTVLSLGDPPLDVTEASAVNAALSSQVLFVSEDPHFLAPVANSWTAVFVTPLLSVQAWIQPVQDPPVVTAAGVTFPGLPEIQGPFL